MAKGVLREVFCVMKITTIPCLVKFYGLKSNRSAPEAPPKFSASLMWPSFITFRTEHPQRRLYRVTWTFHVSRLDCSSASRGHALLHDTTDGPAPSGSCRNPLQNNIGKRLWHLQEQGLRIQV